MPLWGKNDNASNSAIFAALQVRVTPNTANRANLYNNTTFGAWQNGGVATNNAVGQFGVDANEMYTARNSGQPRPAHAGWVLRTVGQGGRSGRIQEETLVAFSTMAGDGDVIFKEYILSVATQPANAAVHSSNNQIATFTVAGASAPAGATLGYYWQYYNGSTFANLTNGGAYSNVATATLSVNANTGTNGTVFRAAVTEAGSTTVYSGNATITISA